jgi:hypothetical protein
MEYYHITIKDHLRSGSLIILVIIICVNFSNILSFLDPNKAPEDLFWVEVIGLFVFALPAIIIHINYYLINRGDTLEYSSGQKIISINHRGIATTFHLNDIDFIKKSISFNEEAHRSSVVAWDGYNHSVIHLKNGNVFTITSLLVQNLDLPIEKEKIIIKRNIYRLAKIR